MPEINLDGYLKVTIRVQTSYDELVVVVPYKNEDTVREAVNIARDTAMLRLEEEGVLRF